MTTYTYPSGLVPQAMEIRYKAVNKVFRSPLNGHTQVITRPGSYLCFDLVYNILTEAQRAELEGFIAKLDGQLHWLKMPYYGHVNRGMAFGTPVVNGANQTGASIITSGWTGSQLQLYRGDKVSIGGELKILTDDVTSVAGAATLPIRPAQRIAPSNGSAIVCNDPTGTFMLASPENSVGSMATPKIRMGRCSFSIEEVVAQP